jgi:hypothetical protein
MNLEKQIAAWFEKTKKDYFYAAARCRWSQPPSNSATSSSS